MCGIVGYIGKNAVRIAVEKLKLLQYRGYDSAGVGYAENGRIIVEKRVGSVENLEVKSEAESVIAHTRWATHGKVCERNAHPHKSGENWAIVHNGIIENYASLAEGKTISDTDSEVIAQMLEKGGEGLDSVLDSARKIEGAFAVLALDKSGKIYAIKNKSPLFVSFGEEGVMFASDPVCFYGFSHTYYSFCDNECAFTDGETLEFYDFSGQKINKKPLGITPEVSVSDKGGYGTFMQKEIYDIPYALSRIFKTYTGEYLSLVLGELRSFFEVWFIGCGTAYHACEFGALIFAKAGRKSRAFMASEFRYSSHNPTKNTLCVFISQSGETADTLGALERVRNVCTTVALTNVGYSALAQRADVVLPTLAGCEVSVASTKAYVCQISILSILASALSASVEGLGRITGEEVARLESIAENLAKKLTDGELVVLGRGADHVTAMECALKIKEVAYVNANAYPTGELKHGFIALIEEGSEVLVFATDRTLYKKSESGVKECESRGARVVVITLDDGEFSCGAEVVRVSSYLHSVVLAQLFALHRATDCGNNPDMPRNLAKSVTVE